MNFSRLPDAAVWPIKIAALAVVYYTAAKLGLALAFAATNASPVWPPSGIALAALLLLGYRVWPGITLGAFVANVTVFAANNAASSAVVAAVSATIAVGNTLEALLGALLLNRLLGSRSPFDRPQDVFWFLIITVGVCLVGASVGTTSLVASDIVPQSAQLVIWLTWWLGDAAGMLIVSPLLIAWLRRTTVAHARGSVRQTLEVIASIAGLMVIGAIVFRGEFGADPRARLLLYLFIPCLAWAAYRHGTRGAATASLIIASMAVWATIHHRGPLDGNNVNTSLILLGCFFGLFAVTGLLLAADMVERRELNGVKPTPRDVAAPWLVLFGCLAGAILGWHLEAADTEREARARFLTQAHEVGARTVERIMVYEATLRGAGALFAASTSVSRDEWRQYIGQLDVEHNFPGLPGVGFAQYVTDADKLALERGAQADGLAKYQVWPAGERGEYAPILYLEPASGRNLRAFGFDMFSDPVRRAAMIRARDSGLAGLSGKVTLVQKDGDRREAGVLVYLPVYRNGAATATPTERQRELIGYVYAPIRTGELMRGVLGAMMPGLALQVFDADKPAPATMMYDSEAGRGSGNDLHPMFATQVPLTLNDHRWTLQLATLPAFENAIDTRKSQLVLLAGTIISLLLFVVFRSLAMTRQSALYLAAAVMRESADRFRSLAESANEAIIVCDAADGVVSWNRGAETIFGYRADEMIGRELSRLLPERYRELLDPVMPSVAGGEVLQLTGKTTEVSGLTRDGKEFPLELSLATWESGQRRFYSAIMRDISDRKEKEAAINLAFREKETLLKEVYHRVKNNLQVIISLLNMKMRTLPEGEYKGALLESVHRVRAMALVHEQLYQSRNLSFIILADYIRDLCRGLGATASIEQRGITINCEGEPLAVDLEPAVPLGLLLNELITNSLKHAFPDGRRGAVRVSLSSAGENMACVVVADNGVGLPATPSTAPSTSIGLKLVEALSRQLDATLTFEINGGTRVSLVFPLRARAAANRSTLPARAAKH